MKILSYIVFLTISQSSCKGKEVNVDGTHPGKTKMEYPYRASDKRLAVIRKGSKEIVAGMDRNEVLTKLGEPDEVNDTFNKDDLHKKVGFSFVYVEQRDRQEGSVKEKNEKLVRVHFNMTGKVIRIDFIK